MNDEHEPKIVDEIRSLRGLEAVRVMPYIFVGSPSAGQAVHNIFWAAVENAIDEAMIGNGNRIDVILDDNITICDNGAGFEIENLKDSNQSILERTYPEWAWDHKNTRTSHRLLTLAGIGVVNDLSAKFIIQVKRDGFLWQQSYLQGKKQSELEQIRPLNLDERTGTTRIFTIDFTIIERHDFDQQLIQQRLREYAFLVPGLTITFEDKRPSVMPINDIFHYPIGVQEFLKFKNQDVSALHPPLIIREETELSESGPNIKYPFKLEIALQFTDIQADYRFLSFVNTFENVYGKVNHGTSGVA